MDTRQSHFGSRTTNQPGAEIAQWDVDPDPDIDPTPPNEALSSGLRPIIINAQQCDPNSLAKAQVEANKRAVILKRNELKWKLMQVSQARNKAKLEEIKNCLDQHREKLSKTKSLALRLKRRYIKAMRSIKLGESQLTEAEGEFQNQEKFVAHEMMELTKIQFECLNVGKSLYGDCYKLPVNPSTNSKSQTNNSNPKIAEQKAPNAAPILGRKMPESVTCEKSDNEKEKEKIMHSLGPFIRRARTQANEEISVVDKQNYSSTQATLSRGASKRKLTDVQSSTDQSESSTAGDRVGSHENSQDLRSTLLKRRKQENICDHNLETYNSVLDSLVTYRLTRKFCNFKPMAPLSESDFHSHNSYPEEYICLADLIRQCADKSCTYMHKSTYMKSDLEKLREILALRPSGTLHLLLTLQTDMKRPLSASLAALASQQPDVVYVDEPDLEPETSIGDVVIKLEPVDDPMLD